MFRNRMFLLIALLLALVVTAACQPIQAMPAEQNAEANVLTVEVAEDGGRFVFSSERLFDDGMPQYGTPFVTQGYIYEAGTLNGSNGVLADGSAEFPDKVIGTWTCYGYMIGDGGHTETGEWVVSTQVYQFNEENGGGIIVTNGFELVDINVPVARAISSGTGAYRSASGEMVQKLLGFTDAMGVNLTVEFHFD
jgi:hypothetical protein